MPDNCLEVESLVHGNNGNSETLVRLENEDLDCRPTSTQNAQSVSSDVFPLCLSGITFPFLAAITKARYTGLGYSLEFMDDFAFRVLSKCNKGHSHLSPLFDEISIICHDTAGKTQTSLE